MNYGFLNITDFRRLDCYTSVRLLWCACRPGAVNYVEREIMTNQSYTFIDPAGNQAQYTVYGADRHNEYHWSTDHGDSGFDGSFAQAQSRARTALKASMAARRRADQRH